MTDPKISIIVPVFNSADYLRRCLNSLINQSLKEIEILIVDDCSTDNSIEIIEEYLRKSNQIIFIKNETNVLPGVIRNNGVQMAKGKYIMFVDSDDWIDSKACEVLFEIAEQKALDILIGKFNHTNGEETYIDIESLDKNPIVYEGCAFMMNNEFSSVVWNKFWLKDFVVRNNVKNTEGKYFQDLQMTIDGLLAAKRVASVDYKFYFNYIGNKTSISRMEKTTKHLNDKQWGIEYMLDKIENYRENTVVVPLKKRLLIGTYAALSFLRRYQGKDKESIKNLLNKIREALDKTGFTILTIRSIPVWNRILIYISPAAYLKASRIFDRFKS